MTKNLSHGFRGCFKAPIKTRSMTGSESKPESGKPEIGASPVDDIQEFADKYGVASAAVQRDSCGAWIIVGKLSELYVEYPENRCHIYAGFADGRFGLSLLLDTIMELRDAKARLVAAGFHIEQEDAAELCATFNPADDAQSLAAISEAGISGQPAGEGLQVVRPVRPEEAIFSAVFGGMDEDE
jgi:hypothetical protein